MPTISLAEHDVESALRYDRAQAIIKSLDIADIIAVLTDRMNELGYDDLTKHPLYGIAAYVVDASPTMGTGLEATLLRLAREAVEVLVDERMAEETD